MLREPDEELVLDLYERLIGDFEKYFGLRPVEECPYEVSGEVAGEVVATSGFFDRKKFLDAVDSLGGEAVINLEAVLTLHSPGGADPRGKFDLLQPTPTEAVLADLDAAFGALRRETGDVSVRLYPRRKWRDYILEDRPGAVDNFNAAALVGHGIQEDFDLLVGIIGEHDKFLEEMNEKLPGTEQSL